MTTITQWLEEENTHNDKLIALQREAMGEGNLWDSDWHIRFLAHLESVHEYLQAVLITERQKHEHDWQVEALEWRRGVGAFVEWMIARLPLGNEGDGFIYETLIRLCPQAIINWNPPPFTPEELEAMKRLAEEENE